MKTWKKVVLIIFAIGVLTGVVFYFFYVKGKKELKRLILLNQSQVGTNALTNEQLNEMTNKQLLDVWQAIVNNAEASGVTLLN